MGRRFLLLSILILLISVGGASAQDGAQIMQGFIGSILGEAQRQQQLQQQQQFQQQQFQQQLQAEEQMRQQLMPYWEACSNGDLTGCEQAARFPLNQANRIQLDQMRRAALQKQAFQTNWQYCFSNSNIMACGAALNYPQLADDDRQRIVAKQQDIRDEEENRRQQLAREQEERRQAAITAEEERRAALAERQRIAHNNAIEAARTACSKRDEIGCRRGISLANNVTERAELVHLLDVATSPLGLTFLKPLNDVPSSTFFAGGVAAILAGALVFLQFNRRRPAEPRTPGAGAPLAAPRSPAAPPQPAATSAPLQTNSEALANFNKSNGPYYLRRAGAAGVCLSIVWWALFYATVINKTGGGINDFGHSVECFFYTAGVCAIVKGIASVAGYWPYEPIIFWISAVALGAGHFIPTLEVAPPDASQNSNS